VETSEVGVDRFVSDAYHYSNETFSGEAMSEQNVKLGQLITAPEKRDAIHIAVAPVFADMDLRAGDHVGFVKGRNDLVRKNVDNTIGIVDPYLTRPVKKGEQFWLCLYPNTVTSLRHHYTHPAFSEDKEPEPVKYDDKEESRKWLQKYAERMSCYDSPEQAFGVLIDGLKHGNLFAHGSDLHGVHDLDDADDLRYHAERFLGIRINWDDFSFSCSC